jgi:hypothetical protein
VTLYQDGQQLYRMPLAEVSKLISRGAQAVAWPMLCLARYQEVVAEDTKPRLALYGQKETRGKVHAC